MKHSGIRSKRKNIFFIRFFFLIVLYTVYTLLETSKLGEQYDLISTEGESKIILSLYSNVVVKFHLPNRKFNSTILTSTETSNKLIVTLLYNEKKN